MNWNIVGFLAGLSAGVGLGILLAPERGERTRSRIQAKAMDGAAYVKQRSADVRDAAADAIRESTRKVSEEAEAIKAAMTAGRQAYTDAVRS
jgi:gas vesicle protein